MKSLFPHQAMAVTAVSVFLALGLWVIGCSSGSDDPVPVVPESGCVACPNPDCHIPHETFASCAYPSSPGENTGRRAIALGGSVVMGVACYLETGEARCGFIPALERLAGMQIANFGQQYFSTAAAVGGLVPYARIDTSVSVNPDMTRAYVMLGGNDIIQYLMFHVAQAPHPEDGCLRTPAVEAQMEKTLGNLRLVVERYRVHHGIPQVVVGSNPPVGETSNACNSCRLWAERTCGDCSQCLNELLGTWSDMVADMVVDMGGADAGIYFADHFNSFPEPITQCSLFCDCPHPNCIGHDLLADIWHAAVP